MGAAAEVGRWAGRGIWWSRGPCPRRQSLGDPSAGDHPVLGRRRGGGGGTCEAGGGGDATQDAVRPGSARVPSSQHEPAGAALRTPGSYDVLVEKPGPGLWHPQGSSGGGCGAAPRPRAPWVPSTMQQFGLRFWRAGQ